MSRQLKLLFGVALLYWAATQMTRMLVAMFLASLGASPATIGVVVAIESFIPLFLAVPVGRLADEFGYRRLLVLGSAGVTGAGLLYVSVVASHSYAVLISAQVLVGLCELLIWTSAQAYATQLGRGRGSDNNIAYFTFFAAIGQMAGPAFGGISIDRWGYVVSFASFTAMGVGLLVSSYLLPEYKVATGDRARAGMLSVTRRICGRAEVQVGMFGTFANLFVNGMWTSFYPVYVTSVGFSASLAGLLVSLKGFASLAARPFLVPASQRLGRAGALILATGVAFLPLAITPLLHSFVLLAAAAVASGAGLGLNLPLTLSIMAHNTRRDERGVAMGLRLLMNRIALLANPLIFGFVSEYVGLDLSFYVSSSVVAALMAVAAGRLKAVAREERVAGESRET